MTVTALVLSNTAYLSPLSSFELLAGTFSQFPVSNHVPQLRPLQLPARHATGDELAPTTRLRLVVVRTGESCCCWSGSSIVVVVAVLIIKQSEPSEIAVV